MTLLFTKQSWKECSVSSPPSMRTGNEPMQPLHILFLGVCCIGMAMGWTFDVGKKSGKMRQGFDRELIIRVPNKNEQFSYICFFIIVICAMA